MRNHWIRWSLPLVLLALVGVGVAMAETAGSSGGTVKGSSSSTYGTVLVSAGGMTLYRFTPDSKGVNTCSSVAACNRYWPRLLVKAGTAPNVSSGARMALVGTIKQPGGLTQVSYAGFPLYRFAGDKKPGDMHGEGVDGTWYVVDASGALVKHALVASSKAPSTTATSSGRSGY